MNYQQSKYFDSIWTSCMTSIYFFKPDHPVKIMSFIMLSAYQCQNVHSISTYTECTRVTAKFVQNLILIHGPNLHINYFSNFLPSNSLLNQIYKCVVIILFATSSVYYTGIRYLYLPGYLCVILDKTDKFSERKYENQK